MTLPLSSYRLRLPLSLSIAAVATAFSMAVALGLQTLTNLREDQGRNAMTLGYAMAGVQIQALRNDDVWLAFSLLRGPDGGGDAVWILVDQAGRIFASNRPRRFRLDQSIENALPWLPETQPQVMDETPGRVSAIDRDDVRRVLRLPLYSDGSQVGELIALLSDAPYLPRFREILLGGVLVTGSILAVLLPIGWLWGRRMVGPLVQLADCMGRVGREDPRRMQCTLPDGDSDSEIGRLGRQFAMMLSALAQKESLEQQMIQAERLAAVGRVAAGVAHEVNNPLGGMLMAIDTYRRAHPVDAQTERLLDLLERALRQIQGSVSALLVEARADLRTLTREDLEDVKTLVQPNSVKARIALSWENACDTRIHLPAAPVRQLLLNLVLNAVQASQGGGHVGVWITTQDNQLMMRIENSGRALAPEQLLHLFEPYPASRPHTQGLGLWVCYQIVSQLGGTIRAETQGELTRFLVALPLAPESPA
ncbi:MAG: HAMP domain-containing histidine kinase [Thiocapsa sp.]|uniref:sensor histidine kinase n=1 Tax=Thiocapsa sp. TaxID=2024551 RepID=UPI001BCE375E|nr:HAMP domain-containing sensor histidine kinase [Thiocapsa sp.]QVL48904.1 MAG: HAMP domain-containing histidine kinase [Thiocapsa sp.]